MMQSNDEIIQKLLEEGSLKNPDNVSEDDFASYKNLFDALKTEPHVNIPADFSSKIVAQLQTQKKPSVVSPTILICVFAVLVVAAFVFVGRYINLKQISSSLNYIPAFLFAVVVFIIFQLIDQRIKLKRLGLH